MNDALPTPTPAQVAAKEAWEAACAAEDAAVQRIRAWARTIEAEFGLTLRHGYIGNLDGRRDDRAWSLWINNLREPNGNVVGVNRWRMPTEDLFDFANVLEKEGRTMLLIALEREGARPADVRDTWSNVTTSWEQSRELVEAAIETLKGEA